MKLDNKFYEIIFSAGDLTEKIHANLNTFAGKNNLQKFWQRDASLWTNTDESQWMDWLDVLAEKKELTRIKALSEKINANDFKHIVLMGMGGSSLCPAMMAETFGHIAGFPALHILDSTDPMQIQELENNIELQKTLFIVSSKSGTTLEPNIFKAYFYEKLAEKISKDEVGKHFVAITDPNTPFEKIAKQENFAEIFHGLKGIGGRYSALSNFGMVPAGLMGVDIETFLMNANAMREVCENEQAEHNPGVVLGTILGVCATHGKDKVTLITSPNIHSLAAWLEQLLAESTGKEGKGIIPIAEETLGEPHVYGDDRVFVYIRLEDAPCQKQDAKVLALEQAGFVVVRILLQDKMHLGAELFRFEMATAIAGAVIGINPFNQPDVEESKVLALQYTSQYEKTKVLDMPWPFFYEKNISLVADVKMIETLHAKKMLADYLSAYLNLINENDYIDIAAFIAMTDEHTKLLQEIRMIIRDHKKNATCLGFGPRFLHSTGQAYKGGPNTGVFLQITCDYEIDINVPDHEYTFGLVIAAQAKADFDVLVKRDRRVLRIHLSKNVKQGLQELRDAVAKVCEM